MSSHDQLLMTRENRDSFRGPRERRELRTWGEIATYLKCDERTAQRWEKSEDLPVRRHMHTLRSRVYAYTDELDDWRLRREPPASPKTQEQSSGSGHRRARSAGEGEFAFVAAAATLYAALSGVSLVGEVAYRIDRFPGVASVGAVVAAVVGAGTVVGALLWDWRATQRGSERGLLASSAVFCTSAVALFLSFLWFLPSAPIVDARFDTFTGQAGYLKALVYTLPLGVVFVALPFHGVLRLQREVTLGECWNVMALTSRGEKGNSPRGAIFVRPSWLYWAVAITAAASFTGALHLIRNLESGPYSNLFGRVVVLRIMLWFALATLGTAWFHWRVNALRRDCISAAVER